MPIVGDPYLENVVQTSDYRSLDGHKKGYVEVTWQILVSSEDSDHGHCKNEGRGDRGHHPKWLEVGLDLLRDAVGELDQRPVSKLDALLGELGPYTLSIEQIYFLGILIN